MTRDEQGVDKKWFARHVDTIVMVITTIGGLLYFYNKLDDRLMNVEKDITVIKTILVMKQIAPSDILAQNEKDDCSAY